MYLQKTSQIKILAENILHGEKRALARAITMIENEADEYISLLDLIYPHQGKAHRIGITGPPGAGKSTLTNKITKLFRANKLTVGIIAVDPSSPFTGGAILGDRVRMQELFMDPGVFIRSMASRGNMGGLARQATEAADVLDAAGKDIIIYETVGVGQVELDIMSAADTTIVLTVPDAGDAIQGMKAGLMEIGDLFIVNKSDLSGADRMKSDLEFVLHLRQVRDDWNPPVILTQARKGDGLEDMYNKIMLHKDYLSEKNRLKKIRNRRSVERVKNLVNDHINRQFWTDSRTKELNDYLNVSGEQTSPYAIAKRLIENGSI